MAAPVVERLSSLREKAGAIPRSRGKRHQYRPHCMSDSRVRIVDSRSTRLPTPKPNCSFRKRVSSEELTLQKEEGESGWSETNTLEVSRKRLLLQQDWVGLEPSQPLTMDFGSRPCGIGKRRKLNSSVHNRNLVAKKPTVPPAPMEIKVNNGRPLVNNTFPNGAEDIHVRIGATALQSQTTSVIHKTELPLPRADESQQFSDAMLFDEQNIEIPQDILVDVASAMLRNDQDERVIARPCVERDVEGLLRSLSDLVSTSSDTNAGEVSKPTEIEYPSSHGYWNTSSSIGKKYADPLDSTDACGSEDEERTMRVQEGQYHGLNEQFIEGLDTALRNRAYVEKDTSDCENPLSPSAVDAPGERNLRVIRAINTGSRLREFCSSHFLEAGNRTDIPFQEQHDQATDFADTFSNSAAAVFASSQPIPRADPINIADGKHQSGSIVTELQSCQALLLAIPGASEGRHAETERQRDEAASEELWKRFLFASRADSSPRSDRSFSCRAEACEPGREALASSMVTERSAVALAGSVVEQESSAFHDDPKSSMLVHGTTSSSISMATRTGTVDSESRTRFKLNGWGGDMEEPNEAAVKDSPALRKHQAKVSTPVQLRHRPHKPTPQVGRQ